MASRKTTKKPELVTLPKEDRETCERELKLQLFTHGAKCLPALTRLTPEKCKDPELKKAFEVTLQLEKEGRPADGEQVLLAVKPSEETQQDLMRNAPSTIKHCKYWADRLSIFARCDLLCSKVMPLLRAGDPEGAELELSKELPAVNGNNELPAIENGESFAAREILRPSEVIRGILYAAAKMVYGGPSKANKTWVLFDLAFAVATGGEWLGFKCTLGRVLYINLELQAFDAQDRVKMIAKARGVHVPSLLDVWNLRGFAVAIEELKPHILKKATGAGYSLIIVDPCYKVMGEREENNPRDIASMLNHFEDIAVKTGAAFAYGAHFAKGNSSSKNAIDRISGSGVHARDPDAILTATPHSVEGCFTLDATLRSFQRVEPFAIRWEFPRMIKDETLDPCDLKQATAGRPAEHTLKDVLCHIGTEPISGKEWKRLCTEDGVPVRSFYRLRKQAINSKAVLKSEDDTFTKSGGLYE